MFERLNAQWGLEIVIPASLYVIPASLYVIPAPLYVIPAQAGIQFRFLDSGSRPE